MGNNQSAEAPRKLAKPQKPAPNKLTKPQTNNTATLGSLSQNASAANSRRNSQASIPAQLFPSVRPPHNRHSTYSSVEAVVGLPEEKPKGQEKKKRRRSSVFRSWSTSKGAPPPEMASAEPQTFEPMAFEPSAVERWSRSNSITTEMAGEDNFPVMADMRPLPTQRASFIQRQPYSHQPRLSLVVEQLTPAQTPSAQSDEGSKRFSRLWSTSKDTGSSTNSSPSSPIPERADPEPNVYAPIRRRSLLTPGIATRNSYIEPSTTSRQSLPSQLQAPSTSDELRRYYHSPRKQPSKPLAELSAPTPIFTETPRAITPSDLDYGHIGAFKLGSLRITNGSEIPTPSDNRSLTMGAEDGYFKPADPGPSTDIHRHTHRRSNTLTVANEIIKPAWTTHSESPLRQEQAPPEFKYLAEATAANEAKNTVVDQNFAFNFQLQESPTKALDLASEYMLDLALSPFSFEVSPSASPTLQTTSKHTALEDDLFAAEAAGHIPFEDLHGSSIDSGYHAGEAAAGPENIKESGSPPPRSLAKADSGYSSSVSLRSFKTANSPVVPAKEAYSTPPKESTPKMPSTSSSRSPVASDKNIQARHLPAMLVDLQNLPSRDLTVVPEKSIPAPPLPMKSAEQRWAAAEARAQVAAHQRQKSLPDNSRPEVKSSSTGKVTKARPVSAQPIFTIQAQRSRDELNVPPVSPQAEQQLENRVSGFPITAIPNTMRKTLSKETLKTILSVGSTEIHEDRPSVGRFQNVLPAVQSDEPVFDMIQKPHINRRLSYQPAPPAPAKTPSKLSKFRKSIQGPVVSTPDSTFRSNDFEAHLSSFGFISYSLGRSPYEIGLGAMSEPNTPKQDVRNSKVEIGSNIERVTIAVPPQSKFDPTIISPPQRTLTPEERANQAREQFSRSRSRESIRHDLRSQQSYDSIAGRNPYTDSRSSSRERSRSRSRSRTRENEMKTTEPDAPPLPKAPTEDDMKKYTKKLKTPPPVSMLAHRNLSLPADKAAVMSETPKTPEGPSRAAPSPSNSTVDPWIAQKSYWYAQRKSLEGKSTEPFQPPVLAPHKPIDNDAVRSSVRSNAVTPRKSVETIRSTGTPRKSVETIRSTGAPRQSIETIRSTGAPRKSVETIRSTGASRKSMERSPARPMLATQKSMDMQKVRSRHSLDQGQTRKPQLSHHKSFESHRQSAYDYGGQLSLSVTDTYDSTYGSGMVASPFQVERNGRATSNYYESGTNKSSTREDLYATSRIHQRVNSTSDMLGLDHRFSGGLGYGFERAAPGTGDNEGRYALVGSAGSGMGGRRKSIGVRDEYGIDFSDVPVFLMQVRS